MKHHYVYEIWYPNGMSYIGVRSCNTSPEDDHRYRGSSKHIPETIAIFGFKIILSRYSTKNEAYSEEVRLHKKFNVKDNSHYYNRANQSSHKFRISKESHKKSALKLLGRKAEDYKYIRDANEKRRTYVGENQTEAQRLGNIRMGLNQRGTKNPAKGHSSVQNSGFNPWYYITPEGAYIEMHDVTKQEFAPILGVTSRQLGNRFHYTNINKQASLTDGRVPLGVRGFTFGNL